MVRQVDIKALVSHIVRGDGSDKCRICMGDTTEGQVYLGDIVMVDEDKPVTLAELLQTITGVEVQPEDELPAGLCSTCTTELLDAGHFRKLCLQAATQWKTTLRLLNKIKNIENVKATFAIINKGQISLLYDIRGSPVTSKSALKGLTLLTGAKEQNTEQNDLVPHSSQCTECGKKFKKIQSLYYHLKESSDLKRACQYCARIMYRDDLLIHLREVHNKEPYPCKKCPAILKNKKQYSSHLDKAHAVGAVYCGECGRSFRSSFALRAHVSIHAPKKCPACDRLFRNQTCYLYHVKQCCELDVERKVTHRTKNKVTVQVTNKFRDKNVKVGLRGSVESECICDYCGKKFAGKKFVCAHIQIVHMKNTHRPCVYCGKILPSAYMTVHRKKHRENDTFTCEFCGFSLKSKLGYTQHIRIHTGEKPYPCKYCGESFSGSSRRSEHIRNKHNTSSIVLNYACNKCPARFRLPYRLKKHIASKHENENLDITPFECDKCNETFGSCRSLLHHSRKHPPVVSKKKEINLKFRRENSTVLG